MRRLFALLVVQLLIVTACDSPDPGRPGVLSVGIREPASLLPAEAHDQASRMIVGALWTPLLDYDQATGKATPRAAETVESADQTTWTVRLRAGGVFHDGSPVTAKSYVDTWAAVAAEHWAGSGALTEVLRAKEISAPDEHTVRIVLDRPFGGVPAVLASPALLPLPASVLASRDWAGFAANPVGNGPFRMAGPWHRGSGGKLVRVADSPGKAREIDFRVGDAVAQYDQVSAGELDLASEVPGKRHESMHHDFADRQLSWPLPSATYLAFPVSDPRFADAGVRHAFAMAVDRAALEAGPLAHQVDPATSVLPPAVAPGARSGTCRPCTHDAAAAKSLLGQVSFTGPVTLYYDKVTEPWAPAIADNLRAALGVDVTAKPRVAGSGEPVDGPFVLTRTLDTASPHELLASLADATGYRDDGFAQLLASADAAAEFTDSAQFYRLTENQLLRDLPAAPLWSAHGHAVWTPRLHNVTATPLRGLDLASLTL